MKAIRIFMTFVLIAAALFFGFKLEMKLNEYRTALDVKTERVEAAREGRKVDFRKLKEQNKDTKGWIWLPDSNIDYPIVQASDNEYYVHRDFDGSYLYDGCIFIDSSVERPFTDKDCNTVIYGHRMVSGAMFNNLGKFKDKEFFDTHKVIIIETEDKSYDLHVIAFCTEQSDSALYTTSFRVPSLFASYEDAYSDAPENEEPDAASEPVEPDDAEPASDNGAYGFATALTKKEFIDLVKEKAVVLSDEPFDMDDTYVTLSTCAYASGKERNQVIGILKDAALETKTIETKTDKPFINKWLALQVLAGLLILGFIAFLVLPSKKGKGSRESM